MACMALVKGLQHITAVACQYANSIVQTASVEKGLDFSLTVSPISLKLLME